MKAYHLPLYPTLDVAFGRFWQLPYPSRTCSITKASHPMTKPIEYVMIGGFLGAGKTTTIARLAQMYQDRGKKVGIVTNDQATDLVDTHTLRSHGFRVGEVAGACFCCNFDELTSTIEQLSVDERPDVLLAEPVGSCTDLVATVIRPLAKLYDDRYDMAPYAVILKPSHGLRILEGGQHAGFSPKAEYIFRKQLEEADLILINRIDELTDEQISRLSELLEKEQPDIPILQVSARSGQGFDALVEMLAQRGDFGRRALDLDYDIYAEGEAELGWLNSSVRVSADTPFDLDAMLLEIVTRLQRVLDGEQAETAHLKVIALYEGFYGVANLIDRHSPPELSLPSHCEARMADMVINARVAIDPERLEHHVIDAVESVATALHAKLTWRRTQSFRPGRPVPTHRLAID